MNYRPANKSFAIKDTRRLHIIPQPIAIEREHIVKINKSDRDKFNTIVYKGGGGGGRDNPNYRYDYTYHCISDKQFHKPRYGIHNKTLGITFKRPQLTGKVVYFAGIKYRITNRN